MASLFSLFAFRLVLPEHNLKRALWTCAEVAPLSLLVGVLVHSGKRFLSLSVFLSFLSLSTILIGFSFSRFLCVAGRSLSALGRLVAAPLSANTAMRGLHMHFKETSFPSFLGPRNECFVLLVFFSKLFPMLFCCPTH
jgi:hypothetical protein